MRAYHGVLQQLKIAPHRSLEEDLTLQTNVMSYGGKGMTISLPPPATSTNGGSSKPDFGKMTSAQRLAYHQSRLSRLFGERAKETPDS